MCILPLQTKKIVTSSLTPVAADNTVAPRSPAKKTRTFEKQALGHSKRKDSDGATSSIHQSARTRGSLDRSFDLSSKKYMMTAKQSPISPLVQKFINCLMISGKKNCAYKLFSSAGCQFLQSIDLLRQGEESTAKSSQAGDLMESPEGRPSFKAAVPHLRHGSLKGSPRLSRENVLGHGLPARQKGDSLQTMPPACLLDRAQILSKTDPSGKTKGENALFFYLRCAIENVQPSLECRKVRIAGRTFQVPAIIEQKRGFNLAIRWIVESARKRKKKSPQAFSHCLAQELLDAYRKQGQPRQRRDQYHKLSESNRGYLRYRWW